MVSRADISINPKKEDISKHLPRAVYLLRSEIDLWKISKHLPRAVYFLRSEVDLWKLSKHLPRAVYFLRSEVDLWKIQFSQFYGIIKTLIAYLLNQKNYMLEVEA